MEGLGEGGVGFNTLAPRFSVTLSQWGFTTAQSAFYGRDAPLETALLPSDRMPLLVQHVQNAFYSCLHIFRRLRHFPAFDRKPLPPCNSTNSHRIGANQGSIQSVRVVKLLCGGRIGTGVKPIELHAVLPTGPFM